MEDSFTYISRLYGETKLKQIKNEVLDDLRNELKTTIENQFKDSCHDTSRRKKNNDDAIAIRKKQNTVFEGGTHGEKKVILNIIVSCKSSSGSLQDQLSPWLPVDTRSEKKMMREEDEF